MCATHTHLRHPTRAGHHLAQGVGNIDVHFAAVGRLGLELMASFVRRQRDVFVKVGLRWISLAASAAWSKRLTALGDSLVLGMRL